MYGAVCIVQRGTGSKPKSSAVEHNTGNLAIVVPKVSLGSTRVR